MSDLTAHPLALVGAILIQLVWVIIGSLTHKDPYPFAFLLTLSNMIQLVLIFVIAVAQKDQGQSHDDKHQSLHKRFDHLLEVLHGHHASPNTSEDLPGR